MSEVFHAGTADVEWRANTGQAEVNIEKLRRQFHEATADMSTQALRASAAQDRLDRALAKHGPSSTAAKNAEVALRRELEQTTSAARRHSGAVQQDERSIRNLARGTVLGATGLRGMARAAVFASTGFLGSFGLTYAIRSAVSAGEDLEKSQRQVEQQFKANGESLQRGNALLAQSTQQMVKFGHSATDTAKAFAQLDRATGDAGKAESLMGLTADLAAARHLDLEKASLVVAKVVNGNTGILKRYGIEVAKGATVAEALAAAQKKLAGQAAAATTPQEQLSAAIHNTEAAIGKQLLPTVQHYETHLTRWLNDSRNQRRIQHDVTEAIRVGTQVVHGAADAIHGLDAAARPLVHTLGGVENTAKLVVEAFAVYKLAKIAGAVRGIGVQWGFVKTQAEAAAAAERAAAGAGVGAGAAGALAGLGGTAATLAALAILTAGNETHATGSDPHLGQRAGKKYPVLDRIGRDQNFPNSLPAEKRERAISIYRAYREGLITAAQAEALLEALNPYSTGTHPYLTGGAGAGESSGQAAADSPGRQRDRGAGTERRRRRHQRPHGFTVPQHFLVDEARAQAEGTQSDVVWIDRAELAYVRAQIKAGHLNKQGLVDAYNEEKRLDDEIDSIVSARRKAAAARAKKRIDAKNKAAADALALSNRDHTPDIIDRFLKSRTANARYKNKLGSGGSASSRSIYDEAAAEFALYGSNIGPRGSVLSGQDARGDVAYLILQAIREGNRHAQTTAQHTRRIGKLPAPIYSARALAAVGA